MAGEGFLFDLDGTLADTLRDIAAAGNAALAAVGAPPRPVGDYRYLAGEGAEHLVRTALGADDPDRVDAGVEAFHAYYAAHPTDHTAPYAGVPEALDALAARGRASRSSRTRRSPKRSPRASGAQRTAGPTSGTPPRTWPRRAPRACGRGG